MKTAFILSNVGTPEAPTPEALKPYLTEFLTDPDVIPLPWALRQLLVRAWIVPRRAPASAAKYQLVWTEQGSPLMLHSLALLRAMEPHLPGPAFLGMQFGKPSMEEAFRKALDSGAERIVLLPLYPQFAEATTGAAGRKAQSIAEQLGFSGELVSFPSFPTAEYFLEPQAELVRRERGGAHLLITFHGLPESQIRKMAGCRLENSCCASPQPHCYRSQCFATARALAAQAGVPEGEWSLSFQSRLGRAKWIGPYTEDVLAGLPGKGVRDLLVVAPSFVSDCLETLEELGHGGRQTFLSAGGKSYRLLPCVNSNQSFARGLAAAASRL